jgi:peptidoglycan/LPS O-acetylase OafA/YrhL
MVQTEAEVGVEAARSHDYRPYLDGLRSVAVYLVVAFHADLSGWHGGFVGVDVFFVLSGYLVTGILLRDLTSSGRVDFRRFYARRFRRILPAAAVALLVTALAYAIVATPLQTFDAIGGFRASFLYVANWQFIHQATDYFATSVNASPVLHFWSLAVEEQFYFVWPLLFSGLYLACRRGRQNRWWLLRAIIAAIALASVLRALSFGPAHLDRAYYGTDTRAYQLLLGALLALTPQLFTLGKRFVTATRLGAVVALVALVAIGASVFDVSAISRGVYAAGITFALIIALEGSPNGIIRRALSDSRVSYLGRISYATYLWHWPIVVLVTHDHDVNPVALFGIAAVGSTVLAALSYHYVEHPIRSWRELDRYRVQVIVVGLTISAVCGWLIAPAILRWPSGEHSDASALSVSAPDIDTGAVKLSDWRKARTDIPPLPDCFGTELDQCTVVRGTGPRVLIMGDSLARMWLPTFTAIAKKESFALSIAALPSCPWQFPLKGGLKMAPECPTHRADWYSRVVPQLRPDIIVLAERAYDKAGNPFFLGSGEPVNSARGVQALIDATKVTVESLRAPGRKLVILESTPLPADEEFDPETCLSQGAEGCGFRVDVRPGGLEQYYRQLADREPDVWALNLDHLACPRLPLCDPVVNGIIVRRDHTHLTATYARALADSFASLLHDERILPDSKSGS